MKLNNQQKQEILNLAILYADAEVRLITSTTDNYEISFLDKNCQAAWENLKKYVEAL